MGLCVTLHDDPSAALGVAGAYLESEPVRHNLILSLLHGRLVEPEPGRYWIAERSGQVVGFVFQSPLDIAAVVPPMEPAVAAAMAETIANAGIALPGVSGEAATAAVFAGQWTECTKSAAIPFEGMRLYELAGLADVPPVVGSLRQAGETDRALLLAWVRGFLAEVRETAREAERAVDRIVREGQGWLWENGEPAAMAVARERVAGVVRIGGVYTPPEQRRRGYAAACVHALSQRILDAGCRPILYTDLGNSSSNAIYRRLGYKAVAECIRYRFA